MNTQQSQLASLKLTAAAMALAKHKIAKYIRNATFANGKNILNDNYEELDFSVLQSILTDFEQVADILTRGKYDV